MPPRAYDPILKKAALALYEESGVAVASRKLGIPQRTLERWAKAAGVRGPNSQNGNAGHAYVVRANRSWQLVAAEARTRLIALMAETAVDLVQRMSEPHLELKVVSVGDGRQEVQRIVVPRPPASAVKDYAIAAAILVDKLRLELGEVSARVEVRGGEYDAIAGNPEAAAALEALWRTVGSRLQDAGDLDAEPTRALGSASEG